MIEMANHPQKKLHNPWLGDVYVDRGIAELLRRLWAHDIETENSCQENRPGTIWIQFRFAADAERFFNHVAQRDRSLFYSMQEQLGCEFDWCADDDADVYDEERDEWLPSDTPDIRVKPSIRFGKDYYRKLLAVFARAGGKS